MRETYVVSMDTEINTALRPSVPCLKQCFLVMTADGRRFVEISYTFDFIESIRLRIKCLSSAQVPSL